MAGNFEKGYLQRQKSRGNFRKRLSPRGKFQEKVTFGGLQRGKFREENAERPNTRAWILKPFGKVSWHTRVASGAQMEAICEAFFEFFLGRADFVKSTTVSHGMLTFACPGVPKRGPKSI